MSGCYSFKDFPCFDVFSSLANVERHAERPDPPFYIMIGSDTYTLQSSSSVRQNTGLIDANAVDQSSTIKVVGEGIIDLESEQKTTRCEVSNLCQSVKQ